MSNVIIFGTTGFERRLMELIELYTKDKVVAFCVDALYKQTEVFLGRPVVCTENISEQYSTYENMFLVGIGYKKMNGLRKKKFKELKSKGYQGYNFIHPRAYVEKGVNLGESNIVLGDAFIDYNTSLGNSNIIENGVHISHECQIGDFNYFSPGVIIGGKVILENSCFLGLGAIVRSAIHVENKALIGAGAYVNKDIYREEVIVPVRSIKLASKSDEINILIKR